MSRDVVGELRAKYEAGTKGEWTWEDDSRDNRFIATLYAGRGMVRLDVGNAEPFHMMAHGMNLFGRMEPDLNGRNNLDLIVAMHRHLPAMLAIAEKAQAVVDRWDTPLWKDVPATAVYIGELRQALSALTTNEGERCE